MNKPRILHIPAHEHTKKVFSQKSWDEMYQKFDLTVNDSDRDLSEKEIKELIKDQDGLITGWGTSSEDTLRPTGAKNLTPDIMNSANNLKIIAHSGGTVRNMLQAVWKDHIKRREICVFNATKEIAYNVAETTIGLIIMTSKRLMEYALFVRNTTEWRSPNIPVNEQHLSGSTVGIIGASDVGQEVIRLLQPFHVRIMVYDPYLLPEKAQILGVEKVELNHLMLSSDIVSIHAPNLPSTQNMIGARELQMLRDGAVLINTSRGTLIDPDALIGEASTGRIKIALDVTMPEPIPAENPLRKMSNVIIVPHLAGQGHYGHHRIGAATVQALDDYFSGRSVVGSIDYKKWDTLA